MRSRALFAALSGIVVSGALAGAPAFAQSDMPIIATITVPVNIDFLDTEAMSVPPVVACALFGSSKSDVVAVGTAPVPMVSTQATVTSRSTSSFDGNVAVTIRPKAAPPGKGNSTETAEQTAVRYALTEAKTYQCTFASSAELASGVRSFKYLDGYTIGTKKIDPLKSTLTVSGTFTAPKP